MSRGALSPAFLALFLAVILAVFLTVVLVFCLPVLCLALFHS